YWHGFLQAWDSGAASIHLLIGEKNLLTKDNQIQQGYAQLQNIRGPDGQDIIAPTLHQWLRAAVLTAYAEPAKLVSSLRKWCTMEEGINLVQQMGMAHALVTGSNPDRVAVTSIKMQFLRGVPASLKPSIIPAATNAMGNIGTLADTLREIGAVISGPSIRVVNKGRPAKPKGVTTQVTRKQMRNNLVQTASIQKSQPPQPHHQFHAHPPPLPATSRQCTTWQIPKQQK
uniref:Uncharacterized protein n=1 Tax=Aquila chrysaetos chrysaetos TaxID=223781 RepID=A0A663EYR4_AQUCH